MVIEPADDVLWTKVDDEIVLMTSDQGRYHGLRGSATRIWELIDARQHDADAIIATLLAEFAGQDVAAAVVREDVAATLAGLEARALIRTRPAG